MSCRFEFKSCIRGHTTGKTCSLLECTKMQPWLGTFFTYFTVLLCVLEEEQ